MPQKRVTPRRCERCLKKQVTVFMYIQEWGRNGDGVMEYRLVCHECGFPQMTLWDGRGTSDGLGADGSDGLEVR